MSNSAVLCQFENIRVEGGKSGLATCYFNPVINLKHNCHLNLLQTYLYEIPFSECSSSRMSVEGQIFCRLIFVAVFGVVGRGVAPKDDLVTHRQLFSQPPLTCRQVHSIQMFVIRVRK